MRLTHDVRLAVLAALEDYRGTPEGFARRLGVLAQWMTEDEIAAQYRSHVDRVESARRVVEAL